MNGLYAYFAYGSNLLPARLLQRCPTAVPYAPAILPNYRLTERLYADVDYAPGKQVHGFVYLLRAHDVARLDRYEGYPQIYRRYTVDVILGDGTALPALIYEMTPKTKEIRNGLPYPDIRKSIGRSAVRGQIFIESKIILSEKGGANEKRNCPDRRIRYTPFRRMQ